MKAWQAVPCRRLQPIGGEKSGLEVEFQLDEDFLGVAAGQLVKVEKVFEGFLIDGGAVFNRAATLQNLGNPFVEVDKIVVGIGLGAFQRRWIAVTGYDMLRFECRHGLEGRYPVFEIAEVTDAKDSI